ncbi:putative nadh:flavin oxidoreductase nadh oxidase protein [Neofusicoccum parvum UCRNP2]|uniref:Putative nadh:flavin oxidoreductase nadh oxidase protein n=1 Tax=Botryosphaeria parva (strain UCR-NP2) TaxID=1287680 RepID=R1GF20_BOTPV|nr:putative nadh:flavin oxidoreductase nadh oxidase protein [Neofusicoccum parvum UCRNP2]
MPDTKLFQPLPLGPVRLTHRITMAPLARFRAGADHTPTPLMAAYYAQRCAAPGTLLVAEASLVSPRGGGQAFGPGLWDAAHVAGWKRVVDAVHARGCVIFAQLIALGRAAEGSSGGGVGDVEELGMRMADPVPQFTYLIKELRRLDLAYLHLFQSRIPGDDDDAKENSERLDLMVQAWGKGKPVLIAGGLEPDSARHLLDEEYPDYDVVAVFGRYFLSTPDLVYRIQNGIPANPYHRETFYGDGKRVPERGYVDYPFSDEYLAEQADLQSGVKWESSW